MTQSDIVEQLQTLSTVYQRLASCSNQADIAPTDTRVLKLLLDKIEVLTSNLSE